MNVSLVPSLHHLTCCRLLTSIFNNLEVHKDFRRTDLPDFKREVSEAIARLVPNPRFRETLEEFIEPLFNEIVDWLSLFERNWYGYDSVLNAVLLTLPHCWMPDGTIDQEKAARELVTNKDLRPINRFVFACTFCFFEDALGLWEILFKIEKAYLKHKSTPIVKHWVEWLESGSERDWDLFIAHTLDTPIWCYNICILKHSLKMLAPEETNDYLLDALIGSEVSSDVMYFCLSMLSKEEQAEVFRESPVEVFRFVSSWPVRHIYYDLVDQFYPYLTEENFCDVVKSVLKQLKQRECDFIEPVSILKDFWARGSLNFQNTVKDDPHFSKPLQFILDFDVTQDFPRQRYVDSFMPDLIDDNNFNQRPQVVVRSRRIRTVRRRYRSIQ